MNSNYNVFSKKKTEKIQQAISNLFSRALEHHKSPAIEHDRLYRALILPEHIDLLENTQKLVGKLQSHTSLPLKMKLTNKHEVKMSLYFSSSNGGTFDKLMPEYASVFHGKAEPEVVAAWQEWVDDRYKIGVDFAHIKSIFAILNRDLKTVTQMGSLFNGLAAVMGHEDLKNDAHKVRTAIMPNNMPAIAPELREGSRRATQLIANYLLLPEKATNIGGPSVSFSSYNMGQITFPWSNQRVNVD